MFVFSPGNKKRHKQIWPSILLSFLLILDHSLFAAVSPAAMNGSVMPRWQALFSEGISSLPGGKIIERFSPDSKHIPDKIVILIQDAHASGSAQTALFDLTKFLYQKMDAANLVLEGAAGVLERGLYQSFPRQELLSEILMQYVEAGEISGPAAAALLSDSGLSAAGGEDPVLYRAAVNAYLKSSEISRGLLDRISALKEQLIQAENILLPAETAALRKDQRLWLDGGISLQAFLERVRSRAEQHGIQGFPLLERLTAEMKHEKTSGPVNETAAVERLFETLKSVAPSASAVEMLNGQQQAYLTDRTSRSETAHFLKEQARRQGLSIVLPEELRLALQLEAFLEDFDAAALEAEIDAYVTAAVESDVPDKGRALNRLAERLFLLKKIVKRELTFQNWRSLLSESGLENETVPELLSRLDAETADLHRELINPQSPFFQFYTRAEEREDAFLKHIKDALERPGPQAVLFVAGGFHSEAFSGRLRQINIPYILIQPDFQSAAPVSDYEAMMKGQVSWLSGVSAAEDREVLPHILFLRDLLQRMYRREPHLGVSLDAWRLNLAVQSTDAPGLMQELGLLEASLPQEIQETPVLESQELMDGFVPQSRLEARTAAVLHWPAIPFTSNAIPGEWFQGHYEVSRSELRENTEPLVYGEDQGTFQNVVFQDPAKQVFGHISVRGMEEDGQNVSALRGFLRDGFEGFYTKVRGREHVFVKLHSRSEYVRSIESEDGQHGIEFDMELRVPEDGHKEDAVVYFDGLQLSSGRFIRDFIRQTGVDPLASEDLAEMQERGETLFPQFNGPVHQDTASGPRTILHFGNQLQQGNFNLALAVDFPAGLKPVYDAEHNRIELAIPRTGEFFQVRVRLLSDHPRLTPYHEAELFKPSVLSHRNKLHQRIQVWEQAVFTDEARLRHYQEIQEYKRQLLKLKADVKSDKRRKTVQAIEMDLQGRGLVTQDFQLVSSMSPQKFNDFPLFKYDTFVRMMWAFQFLLSKEVLLAGSWQYLSYFGRDTVLSTRVLQKYIRPEVFEYLFQSVLDRVSLKGEVAHEEDLRRLKNEDRRFDYRMMDGEFMLVTLARDFLRIPEDVTSENIETFLNTRRAFLAKISPTQLEGQARTNFEILTSVVRNVLERASREHPEALKKVDLLSGQGDPTGNWRDAMNSMARTAFPGDVNAEWIPETLRSIQEMERRLEQLGLRSLLPEGISANGPLTEARKAFGRSFEVEINGSEDILNRLLGWYEYQLLAGGEKTDLAIAIIVNALSGQNPAERRALYQLWRTRIHGITMEGPWEEAVVSETEIKLEEVKKLLELYREYLKDRIPARQVFHALGQDLENNNLAVMNGDFATFASLNRPLDSYELAVAVNTVLTSVEQGGLFWDETGLLLTANPMLSQRLNEHPVRFQEGSGYQADIWEMLGPHGYHGMVMWPSMVNLMLTGFIHQYRYLHQNNRREEAQQLLKVIGIIRGHINRIGTLKNQEVIAVRIEHETGRIIAEPFVDTIESNPLQAWNAAAEIATQMEIEELFEMITVSNDEDALKEWRLSRESSRGYREAVLEWFRGRITDSNRSELRSDALENFQAALSANREIEPERFAELLSARTGTRKWAGYAVMRSELQRKISAISLRLERQREFLIRHPRYDADREAFVRKATEYLSAEVEDAEIAAADYAFAVKLPSRPEDREALLVFLERLNEIRSQSGGKFEAAVRLLVREAESLDETVRSYIARFQKLGILKVIVTDSREGGFLLSRFLERHPQALVYGFSEQEIFDEMPQRFVRSELEIGELIPAIQAISVFQSGRERTAVTAERLREIAEALPGYLQFENGRLTILSSARSLIYEMEAAQLIQTMA